ncbi:MAG: efflux RND transporter periplasmic adaptor subunit [Geminicoccaceae bacterium]|nr:efflux RND transporter periplasmic adaptor subunit [Geminicoccaceae bacterium]
MSTVRQILLSLLLLGGAVGGYYFYHHLTAASVIPGDGKGGGRTISVEVARAVRETVRDRAEAVGTTLANQAIEVVSLASGRITELLFEPGQAVEAGAVLARLDDAIEEADLDEARAMAKEAQSALDRARRLRASNNIAEATVVELEAAAAAAQARVDRAARRLEDRLVRAPFDGVVGIRRVDLGARVDNDTVITTLDDRSRMIVEFMLPEFFYGRIQPGLEVQASSTSFPDRSFAGTLTSIDTRVDVTSRAFRVRASLPNPDLLLPAGLFVLVDITLGERDAVIVPEEAVVSEADRSFVYVAGPERAERRLVELGARSLGVVEIENGLEAGELVVTSGLQRLRDGVAISYEAPKAIDPERIALPSGDIG